MNLRHGITVIMPILVAATAALPAAAAGADACAPIVAALDATVKAPGIRQYMSFAGKSERLVAIMVGPTAYLAIGGPGGWQKMDRAEINKSAKEEAADTVYRDCRSLGSEAVDGAASTVFEMTVGDKDGGVIAKQVKIWVGADGLVRKQQTRNGAVRYEFEAVTPPVP